AEAQWDQLSDEELANAITIATPDRIFQVEAALRRGMTVEQISEITAIDPWFVDQMSIIVDERRFLQRKSLESMTRADWRRAKQLGFSDVQLARFLGGPNGLTESQVRTARKAAGVVTTFKTVDTCAAEFEATTPYHYGTYEDESEVQPCDRPKVMILGSGPNRIGQGIEFDYCCVHASFALRDAGFETIMVNCNPETVSTDYDTSDRLYFEPITYEDVMNVVEAESASGGPLIGIVVSLGGQTPLKLADRLPPELILGTAPSSIDTAEDRDRWAELCSRIGVPQPPGGTATSVDEALSVGRDVGYPALVRPSYVLGGRAMELVYNDDDLVEAMRAMADSGSLGREGGLSAQRPVLIDRFLESAIEVDVDALRDSTGEVVIGGVMEHVEEAGVHSGDSACVLPPRSLAADVVERLAAHVARIAAELNVKGLLNVQFAVRDGEVFVIEANPRASRTVPFVAKATGRPLAKLAARVMVGTTLAELRSEGLLTDVAGEGFWAVKEAVLPFNRFPESDALLGPEMRSTGEVMGIDVAPGLAFVKSQLAAGTNLPQAGGSCVFMSLADRDKADGLEVAKTLSELGFCFVATAGTARSLAGAGIEVRQVVDRLTDGTGVTAIDLIEEGKISMVINTPRGRGPRADGAYIRRAAGQNGIPLVTTVAAALAAARGMVDLAETGLVVRPLQAIHTTGAG
ncbi:MAG: carbamoyl-phosphate synthase large subunit, partial [Acidimicrobiia bacterium]|nr:carbamoyl-phosphate synthase large subunit [Acidimicrobiia bacterium]